VDVVFGDTMFTRGDGTTIKPSEPQGGFDYERFVVDCDNPILQSSTFFAAE
jgi:hypothetical protein